MPARIPLKGKVLLCLLGAMFFARVAQARPAATGVALSVPTANPNTITAGIPTGVGVMVRIPGAPQRVWLERLSSPGAPYGTAIANLGGGDGVYSTQVRFNERSAGTILLQVAASFATPGTRAMANSQTLRSRVFVVRVVQGQGGNSGNSGSGGGLSTGQAVGIGAAIAGAAIAAGWWKSHHDHAADSESKQSIQRNGLTLRYPADWKLNTSVPEAGPISLNTFNSQYLQGGIIPSGGADIDIAYLPGPNTSVQQIMAMDLEDAGEQATNQRRYRIGGVDATSVAYTDTFTPALVYRNLVAYVPRTGGLYKFFLTYHKGDPQEAQFISDFERILKSVRFTR